MDVHHKDPEHYNVLNENEFKLLCTSCHELVERMALRLGSKLNAVTNREAWINLLGDFLPKLERKYGAPIDNMNKQ
jgi:hypothetical protein